MLFKKIRQNPQSITTAQGGDFSRRNKKINPKWKLLINCYNKLESFTEEKYKEEIGKLLDIAETNDIHIFNKPAKDFFNEDLNVETFSALFPDSSEEAEVLPE